MRLKKQQETITNAKPCHCALLKVKMKSIQPTIHASQQVAQLVAKSDSFARHLRSMARYLQRTGELLENNQGKGATHATHLNSLEVASAVHSWVTGQVPVDEGGFEGRVSALFLCPYHFTYYIVTQMCLCKLCRYVNQFLFPKLGIEDTISETSAVRWLKRLGFKLSQVQKGVYVDGHEQPDVVEAHKKVH